MPATATNSVSYTHLDVYKRQVYLRVGVEAQLKRLSRDRTRPLLLRGDREQVLHDLAQAREPLYLSLIHI